jgi:predicted AAA+ superfamily ATPase
MWIQREISNVVDRAQRARPAVLVTGSRQVGKTSLLEHAFPECGYVSLDLPAVAEQAEYAGSDFLRRHSRPLIIDDVQYAPGLFRYLKAAIEERRDENGQFLLTGSQKFALMERISESLAGRVSVIEMFSLSLIEIERFAGTAISRDTLCEWMFRGGYPELVAKGLDPRRFYADHVATYLERDVRQALAVRNLRDFDRFLRLCALRTGQLISMNSLAAEVGVAVNTIKSWLSVLEASGVIQLVEPYYRNLGKRLVKTPKLYFSDTGLACFLAGIGSADGVRQSTLLGALFETLAFGQLLRHFANRGDPSRVCFYRDHQGNEVDFVVPVGEKLRLFECKWAETPDPHPRGFVELEKLLPEGDILSRTILTPDRGLREVAGVAIRDCVEPMQAPSVA